MICKMPSYRFESTNAIPESVRQPTLLWDMDNLRCSATNGTAMPKSYKRYPNLKIQDGKCKLLLQREQKYKRKRDGWPIQNMKTATGSCRVTASVNLLNPGFTPSALERTRKWMRYCRAAKHEAMPSCKDGCLSLALMRLLLPPHIKAGSSLIKFLLLPHHYFNYYSSDNIVRRIHHS